jgi:hypothetical protein
MSIDLTHDVADPMSFRPQSGAARLVRHMLVAAPLALVMLFAITDRAEAQCWECGSEVWKWNGTDWYVSDIPCWDGPNGFARRCVQEKRWRGRSEGMEVTCRTEGMCREQQAALRVIPATDLWAWSDSGSVKAPPCGGSPVDAPKQMHTSIQRVQAAPALMSNDWE